MENLNINGRSSVSASAQNKKFNKTEMAIAKLTDFTKKYAESKIFTSEIQYGGLTPERLRKVKWSVFEEVTITQFFKLYPEYKHINQDKLIDALRNACDEVFDNYELRLPSFEAFKVWAQDAASNCIEVIQKEGLNEDNLTNLEEVVEEINNKKASYVGQTDDTFWEMLKRFQRCAKTLEGLYQEMETLVYTKWTD